MDDRRWVARMPELPHISLKCDLKGRAAFPFVNINVHIFDCKQTHIPAAKEVYICAVIIVSVDHWGHVCSRSGCVYCGVFAVL